MDPVDRSAYIARYEQRLREHGHSPLTLGWGKPGREHIRFGVMESVIREVEAESVLDVGCGFADLYDFLRERGWSGTYHGLELVPGLVAAARDRVPAIEIDEGDISAFRAGRSKEFDVVVASGVFNARLQAEENVAHVERSVRRMFELSRRAISVDFMSTYVDFQHVDAWHTDPAWALGLARSLSRRFKLRHDYMPFEFSLVIYRDDAHPDNVFGPPERRL